MRVLEFCLLLLLVASSWGAVAELHYVRVSLENLSNDIRDNWQADSMARQQIATATSQLSKDTVRLRQVGKKLTGGK